MRLSGRARETFCSALSYYSKK